MVEFRERKKTEKKKKIQRKQDNDISLMTDVKVKKKIYFRFIEF